MDKTLIYARTNGEPKAVEISEVKAFLADGYVKDFIEADNLDVELLVQTLEDIKKETLLSHRGHLKKPWYDMSNRLQESFKAALQAKEKRDGLQDVGLS